GRRKPSSAKTQGAFVAGGYGCDRGRRNATVCSRIQGAKGAGGGAHLAASTTSARRQRFVADSGRVSTMRTTSPTFAVFCSSWAWNLTLRRITFLYRWCEVIMSTLTTIVLSIALETTTPRRSWRRPRSWSGFGARTIGLRVPLGVGRGRVFCGRSRRGNRFRFFLGSD